MNKKTFLQLQKNTIEELQANATKQRRLDARLTGAFLEVIEDVLPNGLDYSTITLNKNGLVNIKDMTLLLRKALKKNNLYSFVNNSAGDINKFNNNILIIVCKGTFKGVIKCKRSDVIGDKITLNNLIDLLESKKATLYDKLNINL